MKPRDNGGWLQNYWYAIVLAGGKYKKIRRLEHILQNWRAGRIFHRLILSLKKKLRYYIYTYSPSEYLNSEALAAYHC